MERIKDRFHFPLMAMGLLALLAAMWAGLVRLGWGWPSLQPGLPLAHGPLMISGFLGTVIGVERAVALSSLRYPDGSPDQSLRIGHLKPHWTFIGPLLTGLGTLALIIGLPGSFGPLLLTLGSLNLVLVFVLILRLQLATFTATMAIGALLWLLGNGLWLLGWPISSVVFWWSCFLILTIAGERLELSRVRRLSRLDQMLFVTAIGFILAGLGLSSGDRLGLSLVRADIGVRLLGAGMVALALWLLWYDVARYTVQKSGLTRFIAVCLLTGYGWLGIGGLLMLSFGGVTAGFRYDAMQHAIFVGFVISMIFGHAPIIFPAILGRSVPFHSIFYSHLVLLHLSLLIRIVGDLTAWLPGRQWGGLLNVVAILLFLANTGRAILKST